MHKCSTLHINQAANDLHNTRSHNTLLCALSLPFNVKALTLDREAFHSLLGWLDSLHSMWRSRRCMHKSQGFRFFVTVLLCNATGADA
jgi:hypothetical protein